MHGNKISLALVYDTQKVRSDASQFGLKSCVARVLQQQQQLQQQRALRYFTIFVNRPGSSLNNDEIIGKADNGNNNNSNNEL